MWVSGSTWDFQNETIVLFDFGEKKKQYSLFCLFYNQNACHCFFLCRNLWLCCVRVCVLYSLDWPAVGCTSVHIKSLAFTLDCSGTRCKVLCGSSAFLKASVQKLWLLIVIFIFRESNCGLSAGGRIVRACISMLHACVLAHVFVCVSVAQTAAWIESLDGITSGLTRRQHSQKQKELGVIYTKCLKIIQVIKKTPWTPLNMFSFRFLCQFQLR